VWIEISRGNEKNLLQLEEGYYPTIESVHRALQQKLTHIRRAPIAVHYDQYSARFQFFL